jgi:hypothetical protein
MPLIPLVLAALVSTACSQDAKIEKLVDLKVSVALQETPQISATNVKDKRWKPKQWIEIETALEAKAPKGTKPEDAKNLAELTLKYYIVVNGPSREKTKLLTGEVSHANVPTGEASHSCMFISPATLLAITGKKGGISTATDIGLWGIEAYVGGKLAGRASSLQDKDWWSLPTAPGKEAGLLGKAETPFAILWGDYHLDVRGK